MLNDETEAIINFVLYPVIFERNLMEAADFLIKKHVIPQLHAGKLNREKLLNGLKDALSKDGWKNECAVTAGLNHSEKSIKALLEEIQRQTQSSQ